MKHSGYKLRMRRYLKYLDETIRSLRILPELDTKKTIEGLESSKEMLFKYFPEMKQ